MGGVHMGAANRETHLSEICMPFVNAYKIRFVVI
jgi:hypothetical protein